MNKAFTLIAIVILAAGGWYAYQNFGATAGSDPGSYSYQCTNDMQFTLSPAADFSWVAITPGEKAPFTQQTLSYRDNVAGVRFIGTDVQIIGSGESVELALRSGTTTCALAADSARMSWDADTTGIGQNLALVVSESIIGKWQGTGETKFTREFKPDGTYTDTHAGKNTGGLWFTFTPENAPPVPFPLEKNNVYFQLADSDGNVAYLKIASMTLAQLVMVYVDRPGVLTFDLVE